MTAPNDNVYKQHQTDATTEQQMVESNMDGDDKASAYDNLTDNVHENSVQQDNAMDWSEVDLTKVSAHSEKNIKEEINKIRRSQASSQPNSVMTCHHSHDHLSDKDVKDIINNLNQSKPGIICHESHFVDSLDFDAYDYVQILTETRRWKLGAVE